MAFLSLLDSRDLRRVGDFHRVSGDFRVAAFLDAGVGVQGEAVVALEVAGLAGVEHRPDVGLAVAEVDLRTAHPRRTVGPEGGQYVRIRGGEAGSYARGQ